MLVVALNSDASVRGLKGEGRPIVPEAERAEVLLALEAVDRVVVYDEPTPIEVVRALLPDVLVKGADWARGRDRGARRGRGRAGAGWCGSRSCPAAPPPRSWTASAGRERPGSGWLAPARSRSPALGEARRALAAPGGSRSSGLVGPARGCSSRSCSPTAPSSWWCPASATWTRRAPDLRTLAAEAGLDGRRAGASRPGAAALPRPAAPPRRLGPPRGGAPRRRRRAPRALVASPGGPAAARASPRTSSRRAW